MNDKKVCAFEKGEFNVTFSVNERGLRKPFKERRGKKTTGNKAVCGHRYVI